jgi:hypothetical protein
MKRMLRLITAAVVLTALLIPAHAYSLTLGLSSVFLDAVTAARTRTAPLTLTGVDYVISKFDNKIVKTFEKAWQRSADGTSPLEGVVLILRMADGTYSARDMGSTNEYKRFTFPWHPAAIAIVHTHPNKSGPQPCGADLEAADKYRVPIFTITNRGMFVYDPGTKKISKVMDDLDWLDQSRWSKALLAKGLGQ